MADRLLRLKKQSRHLAACADRAAARSNWREFSRVGRQISRLGEEIRAELKSSTICSTDITEEESEQQ